MLIRTVSVVVATAFIVGCAQTPAPLELKWNAQQNVDAFADTESCRVTTWYARDGKDGWRQANHIYPVVERRGTAVLVGVMTAPMRAGANLVAAPSGDVQIRIDANPTFTIAAVETPAEVQQGTSTQVMAEATAAQMQALLKNNPQVDAAAFAEMQKSSMGRMSSMMSPRTLATGDKAQQILAQMKSGKTIMYRKVTVGTVTSDPVSFPLDGLNAALAQCGL